MRIMAIDPGEKRIGIAISDPLGIIARPLTLIMHIARQKDAETIVHLAQENDADLIVVGQALDQEGQVGFQARKSARLAEEIQKQTTLKVELWDETSSTQTVLAARREMGISHHRRKQPVDEMAATVILQNYLEAHRE